MNEKQPFKKMDAWDIVEERLNEFSKKVTEMENKILEIDEKVKKSFLNFQSYVNQLNDLIYTDIVIQSEIQRLITWNDGNMSYFDFFMRKILEKYETLQKMKKLGFQPETLIISDQMSLLINMSKNWNLPFEHVGSYLIQKLGKDVAKEIVDKSCLMKYYGMSSVPIWESLTGE